MAKRRANGEGSIRRRNNGRWEGQFMIGRKTDGRREIRSFSGKTRKEVVERKDEFLRKRKEGLLAGQELRFDVWADIWFRNHADNVKPTTLQGYSYTLRTLKAYFGMQKLAEIRPMRICRRIKSAGASA